MDSGTQTSWLGSTPEHRQPSPESSLSTEKSSLQTNPQPHRPANPTPLQLKKKLRESCNHCALSKVRCSKDQPCCVRCVERGLYCHYAPSRRTGKRRTWSSTSPAAAAAIAGTRDPAVANSDSGNCKRPMLSGLLEHSENSYVDFAGLLTPNPFDLTKTGSNPAGRDGRITTPPTPPLGAVQTSLCTVPPRDGVETPCLSDDGVVGAEGSVAGSPGPMEVGDGNFSSSIYADMDMNLNLDMGLDMEMGGAEAWTGNEAAAAAAPAATTAQSQGDDSNLYTESLDIHWLVGLLEQGPGQGQGQASKTATATVTPPATSSCSGSSQTPPRPRRQTARQPPSPPSSPLPGQDCMSRALAIMHALHMSPETCVSLASATSSSYSSPRIDTVLSRNKAAINSIHSILSCPCAKDQQLALVLTLITGKIIAWYGAIATHRGGKESGLANPFARTGAASDGGIPGDRNVKGNGNNRGCYTAAGTAAACSDNSSTSTIERLLHLPISVGAYCVDSCDGAKLRAQLVLTELHRVVRLVDQLSRCFTSSGGSTQMDSGTNGNCSVSNKENPRVVSSMGRELEVFLRMRLETVMKETVDVLEER